MAYTLISFVGTGQTKDGKNDSKYDQTTYQFPDGKKYTTAIFLDALLKANYKPIEKIILLGTRTSYWDLLLDGIKNEKPADYTELFYQINEQCRNEGISDEMKRQLEEALSEILSLPVVIKPHTPIIDAATIPEIFTVYDSIVSELAPNTDVLLDITHSFRSMPILAYQALQFGLAGQQRRSVELVYGEIKRGAVSPARDLSQYWHLSEITGARNLFINRLDGKPFAKLLEKEWPEGSLLVSRFSTIVECNFSHEIPNWIKESKQALARPITGEQSQWVHELREKILPEIIKKLDYANTSDVLRAHSRLLEDHGLFVQAIITLQASIETRTIEAYGSIPDEIGDYKAWKKYKKKYIAVRRNLGINGRHLSNVYDMRNKIAHGGTYDRDNRAIKPTAEAIRSILKNSKQAVHEYFEQVKPNAGQAAPGVCSAF